MTYLSTYAPAPEMVRLAEQTARKHPALAVAGREMVIVAEVANLRRRGYSAICIAGYNDEGFLSHWHRLPDTPERIEPDTSRRAACYTWALIREIDALPA